MIITAIILSAIAGIFAHWLKSWFRETISLNFFMYLVEAPKHTGAMLFTLITGLFSAYHTGMFDTLNEQTITIAFLSGFAADSSLNAETETKAA